MTKPETEKLPELPEPFGDFYSDDKCDSLPDVYTADQMRAYALAAIRAKGMIFVNDGTTEAQFIADGELACPHCGGSGHRDDVRAQGGGATPDAKFPWENFPCYLIDKCEGETVTEESLHDWLADFLKNPRYHRDSAPAGSGEVADDAMKIADFFEGVRVFVTSREKIKHPEGTDLFDWHVKRLRRTAALLRKLQQGAG